MKRKLLITASAVICVLLVGAAALEILHIAPHTGVYLSAANGEPLVVVDSTPFVVSPKSHFDGLQGGDKLLVFFRGTTATSCPAEARVYVRFKLGKGDLSDIPESVRNELEQLGWISSPD